MIQMPETIAHPLISIIMPTYNRAGCIIETIESIQKQTYKNWELIIVDDGSKDNTIELIGQLKDGRIKFYEAGRIGLVGKIKNIGIRNSAGTLIAFIDSDDLWSPEKLEKQVTALQEYNDAAFCVCGGYNFKIPGEPLEYFYKTKEGKRSGNFFIAFFQSQMAAFTQTFLLKRECLAQTGYFDEYKNFSDIEFITELSLHFNGVIVYEPLVFRRLHENNHNHSSWIANYYAGVQNILAYKKKLPRKVFGNALFKLYVNFGEDYLVHKKRTKAIAKFLTSWKYKPFSIVPIKKTGKALFTTFLNHIMP